jgi:adenylate cyclase
MSGSKSTKGSGRQLAAILAADVAGYSRLMGDDEAGTLAALKQVRRDLVDPKVKANRGRIVKTTGDGLLVEFASVVDAVRCAAEVQGAISALDPAVPTAQIRLRIGVNLGDIIKDGGDIYGDGVNIAARLEALAEPGGIVVSNTVHDQVRDKLALTFEDLGERDLKNIARPVRVYRVNLAEARRAAALPAKSGKPALAMPEKPSIAVLPFSNLSGDPEQDFVAEGLTEDIITGLARLSWLFVIARNSTFVYKGKSVDVRQVARELGVRYVLEGSVRVAGKRIRITGQLIEAETGKHIWAQKYDDVLEDLFGVQDDITERVVAAVEPHLYAEEGFRAAAHPDNVDAWGRVVRAMGLTSKLERWQNDEAQRLLGSVIEVSPHYARAYALLAWTKWWAVLCYWAADPRAVHAEAAEHAQKALSLDATDPWARMVAGLCLSSARRHDHALAALRAALDLNPSFALGHMAYGWGLMRAGRFDDAIAETAQALRLSPLDSFSGFYTTIHGLALLGARRFEEALPFLRKSVLAFAGYAGHYNTLISCCGHLGLLDDAKDYIAARNKIGPPLRLHVLRENLAGFAHCDVFVAGLEKAGVPE